MSAEVAAPPRGPRYRNSLVAATVSVVVLTAVSATLLTRFALDRREHLLVLTQTQSVVTAVRDLARLETAEYHIERVIDLRDEQRRAWGLVAGSDELILIAAGDVVAGVDLGGLTAADVRYEAGPRRVTVRLPRPVILGAHLDEKHTYVHTRRTDLLAERDERLESKAREMAASLFEKAALERGILDRAEAQAERVVRALVLQLGVREVRIEWRAAPGA